MGHAAKDMSDRYDRVREDVQFRKDVARSMGVGFGLPKTLKAVFRTRSGREMQTAPAD
jgi:hypothetical protein